VRLSLFAVPLGFAGLAAAWNAAVDVLGAPTWVSDALFWVGAVLWLVFGAVYIAERAGRSGAFRSDREDPAAGAAAAFLPVIGILLVAHFGQYFSDAVAQALCWFLVAALALVAAQLFGYWLTGELDFGALNPGYFLPLVAGPFIAGIGLTSVHAPGAARSALGVGVFFWLVVGSVVTARLIGRGTLPQPAIPSLSLLLAPPAVGGIALFGLEHGTPGPLQESFLGIFLVMLLIQLALLGSYRKAPFSLAYWNFTFPIAAAGNYSVRWFGASTFDGRKQLAWAALSLVTVIILCIALATVRSVAQGRRRRPRPTTE
jgi:tellurite resistance protein